MAIGTVLGSWVKRNPIPSLIGGISALAGCVAGLPPAWQAVSQVLRIPECLTYSNIYYYPNGHFRDNGKEWIEYQSTGHLTFQEFSKDRNYITLLNKTRREGAGWESMLVRLPVCGGSAQWTYQNPQEWHELYNVTRTVSSGQAEEQGSFEISSH